MRPSPGYSSRVKERTYVGGRGGESEGESHGVNKRVSSCRRRSTWLEVGRFSGQSAGKLLVDRGSGDRKRRHLPPAHRFLRRNHRRTCRLPATYGLVHRWFFSLFRHDSLPLVFVMVSSLFFFFRLSLVECFWNNL